MDKNLLIGMPTLIELNSFHDNLVLCKKLKLNLLEINMNLPQFQIDELRNIEEIEEISLSIHLPEELNVWDFNNIVRKAYLETIKEVIDIAYNKNIAFLNMHMNPGIYFTLPNVKIFLFEKYKDKFLENTIIFIEEMKRLLAGTNLKFSIENTGIYNYQYIQDALNELLKSNFFELTWDIGHDYKSNNTDSPFLFENFDRIRHLHMHDAFNNGRDHLPLGNGKIDFKNIISLTKDKIKSIVLETKTIKGIQKSISYFNNELLNLFV